MPRNSIHDIKPSIKLRKSKGYESRRLEHDDDEYEEEEVRAPRRSSRAKEREVYENPYHEKRSGGGKAIWYVAAFCLLFLVFALSFFFSSAKVIVTPRSGTVEINKLVVANKDPLDAKSLTFDTVTLEGEESVSISSTEKKYVEKKATGSVRLFNETTSSQKLLIDTRLVTTDGKIYKTAKALTIPAKTVVAGKSIPGSVDVDIYADEAGEEYNKTESDFKIFGFKGSPKYESFYARSTSEISGGLKGDTFALSDEEETTKKELLEKSLKDNLLTKARKELPEGFIIYDDAVILDKQNPEIVSSDTGSKMIQKGTLHAFIFKKENLTRELVKESVADFDKNRVFINDLEKVDSVSLSIKGKGEIIWEVDEDLIKEALVGIKEREFESTIGEFRNIEKAELAIKPFWKMTVPSEIEKISIINTLSQK